jgi:phosphoribosylglycinamide formyltransferase 1
MIEWDCRRRQAASRGTVLDLSPMRRHLAILLSGRGSNFEAIADAVTDGRIPNAELVAVISDQAESRGLGRARERGIPSHALERERFSSRREHEGAIERVLDDCRPDLICLAGYMRLLSPEFVARYRGRILNIHPSLLPKFPGLHPQRRALEAGESISGCTVHWVDEGTDTGPILLQKSVRILPGDTEESLSARILEQEHTAYPEAIAKILTEMPKQA